MNVQRIRKITNPRCFALFALLLVLIPGSVFATHFGLSRLANQIYALSDQLAHDLRHTRNYGSVRQRAVNLSREASQLVDTLRRNRSNSRVRSQFRDVRRGYERLEQAFFRADRRDHDPRLYQELNLLSNLFTNLSNEFYHTGYGRQNAGPGYYDSRSYSSGVIVRQRERAIPPVFRGNNGRANSNRHGNRSNAGRDRFDYGSRTAQRLQSFDHSSRVLDRQSQQNADRRELENQSRGSRVPARERQSSSDNRGQRIHNDGRGLESRAAGRRGGVSETRRRNHYE